MPARIAIARVGLLATRTACVLGLLTFAAIARAQIEGEPSQPEPTYLADTWHGSVSPYLGFAGLDADLTLSGHTAAVHQSFGDIFSNLKVGVMVLGEVRRGRIGVLTDLLFVRVGDQKAVPVPQLPFPVQVRLTTNTFTLTPQFAYRVYVQKHFVADALGGLRLYHIGADSRFDFGPLGQFRYADSNNWADVTVGGRLLGRFSPKLGAFVIGDAGGGGSSPTWEIVYGVGYKVFRHATTQLGYRRLYFDRQDGSRFRLAATQQGLILGTTIRFGDAQTSLR